ncbi:MAG: glycosyltransferase family 39 protein [Bacteroidales bacterium]|nr:glycosyltransferase family 39 protein [Bacteroidales bacterium]
MKRNVPVIIVCLIAAALFVPWLGETCFYSKGEPREAVVAMTMLQDGNWILPQSYGADIPYKPPLLAWLIAVFSAVLNGGTVNEFTSRLPSALAAIAMLVAGWRVVAAKAGERRAWVMTLVTMTSFEVFRAAVACRVDMVLTACMVGAIYALYTMRGHPWRVLWAVLLLSGATLSKGPVGALLPCAAMGLYMLLRGDNFLRTFLTLTGICAAAFILPALWYYAAWLQGGDDFIRLALEENIGRLTGSMSYDSHVNPWWYNLQSIVAGMLPWTVPVLIALCYRSVRTHIRSLKLDRGLPLMAWTVGLTVLVFYCIPESKRSVYLLPCYPFMAYGAAWVLGHVSATRLMRAWSVILAIIALLAPGVLIAASYGLFPGVTLMTPRWWQWPFAVLPMLVALWWLLTRRISRTGLKSALGLTYVILLAYNAAYMPMVLNARSDIQAAEIIEQTVPEDAPIVTYIPEDRLMRYYSINFYLGDRLRRVERLEDVPADAWLLTSPADSLAGTMLTPKSTDTRRPVILVHPNAVIKKNIATTIQDDRTHYNN